MNTIRSGASQPRFRLACLLVLAFCGSVLWGAKGADLETARQRFLSGQYSNCAALCSQAIADREYEEEWRSLLAKSQFTLGQYLEAGITLSNALDRYTWSVPLRLLAHEILPYSGDTNRAAEALAQIESMIASRTDWRFRDAGSLLAIGRAALLLGVDARKVQDNILEPARKANPDNREVYLTLGELALDKHDFNLAAKQFNIGLKNFPDDPDLHFGLARAFESGNRKEMLDHVNAVLEHNTNHVGAMLLLVDHLIAGEDYEAAEKLLVRVFTVNPWQPEAWASRAVLRHLASDAAGEKVAREKALQFWQANPQVDFLIGKNLSQKYRFAEGAAAQRRALAFDSSFVPAKAQLAEDLLRLGNEAEGWRLAEEARKQDEYDVTIFNLLALKDKLAKFATLTNADIILRMSTNEAPVYGEEVLALLSRCRATVTAKYGATLSGPTVVEIFPEQKDFGVRTFGMPDNPGFLGVCFGAVITANSPASQTSHAANWQAVLWHEFTHVVTLQMTRNKMPRWLSEGISVFEELQADPTWGQRMTVRYREMILGDELTPISELSSAFLAPKTPMHLQFAYFESELAVEFIVKNFGFDALKKILRDLGQGMEINQAIAAHTAPMDTLETDFAAFARTRALALAPGLDFEKPEPADLRSTNWLAAHPTNFWALQRTAMDAMRRKDWAQAQPPLQKLTDLYPTQTGEDSACALLARVHRELGDTNAERAALEKLASLDGEAVDAFNRLANLGTAAADWKLARDNARRSLAVNPLVPQPHRLLAQSAEALSYYAEAARANRVMLLLDPPNPAEVHYRLARLLQKQHSPEARRQVLQALEEAPRYRDALRLLREVQGGTPTGQAPAAPLPLK